MARMGEQTIEFASRFATAVDLLGRVATDEGHAAALRRFGARLVPSVADALAAVAEVHETGTDAVRQWSERRARVLAQVSALQEGLARRGLDPEVRRGAGVLVDLLGGRRAPPGSGSARSR